MSKYLYCGPLVSKEERMAEIKAIIASGKAVRFTNGTITKDVKDASIDKEGDMTAFRTQNAQVPHVCWDAAYYSIRAVDI
jgi:hypothetical protein